MKPLRKQGIIIFSILALVLVACGGDTARRKVVEETTPEVVETLRFSCSDNCFKLLKQVLV